MRLSVISFTKKGNELAKETFTGWQEEDVQIFQMHEDLHSGELLNWTKEQFRVGCALVWIGACGIAVRAIAPCVQDKLSDSPVVCMDEGGQFVIPILSGHAGGANALAKRIAEKIGAIPVITTATDVNDTFAVDLFALQNDLAIQNREGIARISAKVLQHEMVDIVISPDLTELSHGVLRLKPREYIIGIGCRQETSYQKLDTWIQKKLGELRLQNTDILALASIDLKKQEECLIRWSNSHRVPFVTYTAEELQAVEGIFSSSDFVKERTGVDNVCERAAMNAAGEAGELILKKQAEDGMTIAVARKKWTFDSKHQEGIVIEEV